jgi:hypothetical protein
MKKKDIHFMTIIAGLLVMISIVCSNVLLLSEESRQAEIKTEKTAGETELEFIVSPPTTVPTTFTIAFNTEIHYLFEVCSGFFKPEASEPETQTQPLRYLLTLFRVIISPNAP